MKCKDWHSWMLLYETTQDQQNTKWRLTWKATLILSVSTVLQMRLSLGAEQGHAFKAMPWVALGCNKALFLTVQGQSGEHKQLSSNEVQKLEVVVYTMSEWHLLPKKCWEAGVTLSAQVIAAGPRARVSKGALHVKLAALLGRMTAQTFPLPSFKN